MNTLGSRLRALRKGKRINQSTLGKILGVSKVSVSGYENGTREPDITSLIKLADYFNVTVDYLINRNKLDINKNQPIMIFDSDKLTDNDLNEIMLFIEFKKNQNLKNK